ncbi:MAG: hypothetical protein EBZ50_06410 [Alphaproteobacteria bacterium]|nr:hypothetical protein [Alphaproteobacteria bacterium]
MRARSVAPPTGRRSYVARATAAMSSFATDGRTQILTEAADAIRSEMPTSAPVDAAEAQRRSIANAAQAYLRIQASPAQLQRGTDEDTGFLATVRRQFDDAMAKIKKVLTGVAIGAGVLSAAVVAGLVWWFAFRRKK